MNQTLHIFRKDTRRFWPEILVTLAVTVGFACVTPATWQHSMQTSRSSVQQALALMMNVLVPLSWWLLLARAVHAEGLVGENQAWLTRPYEWGKLLAAKALFCIAYTYGPLLIAQCVLLHLAGFAPSHFAAGVAYDGMMLVEVILLPLFVIACVTATFARMTLTLLGLIVAMIGVLALAMHLRANAVAIPDKATHVDWVGDGMIAFLVAMVVLQYRLRRTWLTRGLLLGAGALLVVGMIYPKHGNVEASYPQVEPWQVPLLKVAYAPGVGLPFSSYPVNDRPEMMGVWLPVEYSGVAPGYAADFDFMKLSVDAPGTHWESGWQGMYQRVAPGVTHTSLNAQMSKDVYDKLRGKPATLRVEFAISRLKAVGTTQTTVGRRGFALQDGGYCAIDPEWRASNLVCRFAPKPLAPTYVAGEARASSCASDAGGMQHLNGSYWLGYQETEPGPLSLSGVRLQERAIVTTTDNGREYTDHFTTTFCPGTVLTLTRYSVDGRTRAEMVMEGFVIPIKLQGEL